MKIIAKTDNNYLLEATKEELALILGYRNSQAGFSNYMVDIGREIPIAKIVGVSRFVHTLDTDELDRIKKSMERAINDIDDAVATTQEITLFAKLAEDPT